MINYKIMIKRLASNLIELDEKGVNKNILLENYRIYKKLYNI